MPAISSIHILLVGVIVILTGLLTFIGVQVILILREVHNAAVRLNKHEKRVSPWSILGQLTQQTLHNSHNIQHLNGDGPFQTLAIQEQEKPVEASEPEVSELATTAAVASDNRQSIIEAQEAATVKFAHIKALQERGRRSEETSGSESRRVFHREGKPLA